MQELRLNWEPQNQTPLIEIEERYQFYVGKDNYGVSIMCNGTIIQTETNRNYEHDAVMVLKEAKFFIDFIVIELKLGGYAVKFHNLVSVFVGKEEFESQKEIIQSRIKDLMFPEEIFFGGNDENKQRDLLVGLYARGKLQYDAHHFCFYKRIDP